MGILGEPQVELYNYVQFIDGGNSLWEIFIHLLHLPFIHTAIGDLVQVTDYLLGLQHIDIYNLGLTLGLYYPHLNKMETSKRFRDDVIAAWLQKEDQVLKMGTPTWETLVKALRDPRVNQTGVASKIAADKNVTK